VFFDCGSGSRRLPRRTSISPRRRMLSAFCPATITPGWSGASPYTRAATYFHAPALNFHAASHGVSNGRGVKEDTTTNAHGARPEGGHAMEKSYTYEATLAASQKVSWRLEDVIGSDKQLDFRKPLI